MLRFMLRGGLLICAACVVVTLMIKALGWFVPQGERLAFFRSDESWHVMVRELSRNLTLMLATDIYGTRMSFSPDGDLVFGTENFEIFSVNSIGTDLRRISPRGMRAEAPMWSPDGTKIAFLIASESIPYGQLAIVNRDGQDLRQFAVEVRDDVSNYPIWVNNDQIFLRFSRHDALSSRDLIVDTRSGSVYDLYGEDQLSPSALYPTDSTKMMIVTASPNGRAVSIVHLLENGGVEVEDTPLFTVAPAAAVFDFQWSPDNTQLLFTLQDNGNYEITLLDTDGDLHNISRNPARDWNPVWSPDGQSIAFLSNRSGQDQLYVVGVDGSNLRTAAYSLLPLVDWSPVWLP